MSVISHLRDFFAHDGLLAAQVDHYRTRPQQVEMAQAIAQTIERNDILVVEAGTGTGKTFAYLAPALLCGGKVIISTGTKTLQDQLYNRDLPTVRAALRVPVGVAMLKGRANYLCHHHLQRAVQDGRFASREEAAQIQVIRRFGEHSESGDKNELPEVPVNASIWAKVTSTRDNCLGNECAYYKQCFVMEARKKALRADVVVVNHHLFFADVMLRDEGVAELLPAANTVIFDEAHQLPEIAGLFFGESVSTYQLLELVRDTRAAYLAGAKDCVSLQAHCLSLEKLLRDFRLVFGLGTARMSAHGAGKHAAFQPHYAAVCNQLMNLITVLETQAGRTAELNHCWLRAVQIYTRFTQWLEQPNPDFVYWLEVSPQSVQLHATPLSVAEMFGKQMRDRPRSWIFTSATLAVGDDFSHYLKQMGLLEAKTARWDSPFDYAQQAMLFMPPGMPQPNSADYQEAVARSIWPVIQASRGRAFVLCTSLRAVEVIHRLLADYLYSHSVRYPLLRQGDLPQHQLLEQFRQQGNAILVASISFWEGVDVRGNALALVIIDKLPFAAPDDPVLAARIAKMTAEGLNAFVDYQLPYATIVLKQGVGRLIRDTTDRGVLMICDPRLLGKGYGKSILHSLPAMRHSTALQEVKDFFLS